MNPLTFIFIGRSGCGKGTQAELLKKYLTENLPEKRDILHIETGIGFREFIKGEGFSNKLSKAIMDRSERQPSFLAVWMWGSSLIEDFKGEEHLIFDGIPRALTEAQVLSTALDFYSRQGAHVIYLNVSRAWSEKRLEGRGRFDDATFIQRAKRMDWFDRDVFPAIEYMNENDHYHLYEINGEQTIPKVHSEIIKKVFDIKFAE